MLLKIKELRNKKNISQEELALKTGLSKRMIIDYEKENRDIPVQKLQLIAKALDVNLSELFNLEFDFKALNEPEAIYHLEKKDLLESKNETIAALKNNIDGLIKDKQKLENDKDFLKNVILGKMGNANAS